MISACLVRRTIAAASVGGLLATGFPAQAAAPRAYVVCWNISNQDIAYRVKPKNCNLPFAGKGAFSADRVDFSKLRWHDWGKRVAFGKGKRFPPGGPPVRTRLILSGREKCDDNYIYRRATVREAGKVIFRYRLYGCQL